MDVLCGASAKELLIVSVYHVLNVPQVQRQGHNMTELLLTGTLNLNSQKSKKWFRSSENRGGIVKLIKSRVMYTFCYHQME